jgi:hypothetical protein
MALAVLAAVFVSTWTVALAQETCVVTDILGCYADGGDNARLLASLTADEHEAFMTQEYCAFLCSRLNYTMSGVEIGYQCFCADSFAYTPTPAPNSDCAASPCTGNSSQACGGNNRILVYQTNCQGKPLPNGHACT